MSANRRRKLLLEPITADSEEEDIELLGIKSECQIVFSSFGVFFDAAGVLHLIVCGCAIAYMLILTSTNEFSVWARFFSRLSQAADYFFYVMTFILFVSTFSMTALLVQIKSRNTLALVSLGASAVLQAVALVINTYCIPMSIMVRRSVDEWGEWYASPMAEAPGKAALYDGYRPVIIFRLVCVAVTGPVVSFFQSRIRSRTFYNVFTRL
jgi:hypothetical protein